MRSLAIIRATDILKLKSTLMRMTQIGLTFEGKPKEINPLHIEKTVSKVSKAFNIKYEISVLVPIDQDYESSKNRIKNLPFHSDVIILDASQEPCMSLIKLIPMLPDLEIPDTNAQIRNSGGKSSAVYLGVFINRRVQVQTGSGTIHTGVLKHADSIGVLFEPSDNSDPVFMTWHDIKKIVLPKEENKR